MVEDGALEGDPLKATVRELMLLAHEGDAETILKRWPSGFRRTDLVGAPTRSYYRYLRLAHNSKLFWLVPPNLPRIHRILDKLLGKGPCPRDGDLAYSQIPPSQDTVSTIPH